MMSYNKTALLKYLSCKDYFELDYLYDVLDECNALKSNYNEYMTTAPINCDEELLRLPDADIDLCCALLTMLLREDYFCEGSFDRRQSRGQVKLIIDRIIYLITTDN